MEERKFWIFESVMFLISGISYSLVFLRQKQHVRINFATIELDILLFTGSQNVPEDSKADSSRSLTCLQRPRSVILSVILSPMIFQASGEYTGCFFNWAYPLDWPPPKMPRLPPPPKSCKYENHIEVLRHLVFFSSWGGGQSGTLSFF